MNARLTASCSTLARFADIGQSLKGGTRRIAQPALPFVRSNLRVCILLSTVSGDVVVSRKRENPRTARVALCNFDVRFTTGSRGSCLLRRGPGTVCLSNQKPSRMRLLADSTSLCCVATQVNEVVVPLLSMQSSTLLCISTLLDGSNHYTKMIALRDETGKPVFESEQACFHVFHPWHHL